jgi:hypothetical protein
MGRETTFVAAHLPMLHIVGGVPRSSPTELQMVVVRSRKLGLGAKRNHRDLAGEQDLQIKMPEHRIIATSLRYLGERTVKSIIAELTCFQKNQVQQLVNDEIQLAALHRDFRRILESRIRNVVLKEIGCTVDQFYYLVRGELEVCVNEISQLGSSSVQARKKQRCVASEYDNDLAEKFMQILHISISFHEFVASMQLCATSSQLSRVGFP